LWGYEGSDLAGRKLEYPEAKKLLMEAVTVANISSEAQENMMTNELDLFEELSQPFLTMAEERAEKHQEAHGRFRNLVGGKNYEKVYPILPPDILGIYILQPPVKKL
jgi:hypothetical protein